MSSRRRTRTKARRQAPPQRGFAGLALIAIAGLAAGAAALIGGFWAAGIIGDDDGGSDAPPADPEEVGQQVFDVYVEMLLELEPLIAGRPEPAAVQGQVEDLRDRYIDRFGDLRDRVDDLDDDAQRDARSAYEERLFNAITDIQQGLGWYSAAVDHYAAAAPGFSTMLEELSLIPYHAFADQLSDEERRQLGID